MNRWPHLCLAVISAGLAVALRTFAPQVGLWPLLGFGFYSAMEFHSALTAPPRSPTVLKMGGLKWSMDEFCRGWLITGRPGTGKTTAAINRMLWQITENCPTWGGVCVDDKGLYWETLSSMYRHLGRQDDLILLQVRPEGAGAGWKPAHTFNILDDRYLPDSAKAKLVCDVAASLGQRSEQSFFKTQAQIQIEYAFKALRCAEFPVTLENTYEFITSDKLLREVLEMVEKRNIPEAQAVTDHFKDQMLGQPVEQLGGVKTTVANYLKYFTDPDIAAVFCAPKSSFSFGAAIDHGKVICVSIPQRYQVERRYINTLLKYAFYSHALRRFDKSDDERARDNLIILWADEAQRIVTSSDDGMSDHNVVDVIREARATVVAATQSYTSLIPPMGDEQKAKVLIANLANRITFCAADEESAKIAADTLGKYEGKRRTDGYSGGQRTYSWTPENKYFVEPHEFRKLKKFHAVIQHCEGRFRKMKLTPMGPDGRAPSWY